MSVFHERAAAALELWRGRYYRLRRGPFEPTRHVWSRGLALACDHNGGVAFVRGQRGCAPPRRFHPTAFDDVKDGDLVWMRSMALSQFVAEALPRIQARFALVTGDEDWSIPGSFAGSRELCDSPKVVCWFAQNLDAHAASPKLHPLPIGLDFHTISNRPMWGHAQATPAEQEAELDALVAGMPASEDRLPKVHADFHFNKHRDPASGEDRDAVEQLLRLNPEVIFQERMVPRLDLWREKTRHAFVVSPHGNGLDCHRTWESLVLGNIVIVKRSSIDALYDGLPVVIVDDWREITAANLARWHAEHAPAFRRPEVAERLTTRYWIDRIRRTVAAGLVDEGRAGSSHGLETIDPPRVTVLMPAYNSELFIGEAVRSILAQSFRDFELVIVDDGSTDRSLAIARELAARDPRVRVLSGAHFGIVAALNRGLADARGQMIARIDADDVALAGRLRAQVRYFDEHPECVAVGGAVQTIDQFGTPLRTFRLPERHADIVAMLLAGNGLALVHPACLIRREALRVSGGYRQAFETLEDFDLALRLSEVGRVANLADVLLLYRQHAGNTARKHHQRMSRLEIEAVLQSYARRGISVPADLGVPPERRLEPPAQSLVWALFALGRGRPGAAARHAADMLRAWPRTPRELIQVARSVLDYRHRSKT